MIEKKNLEASYSSQNGTDPDTKDSILSKRSNEQRNSDNEMLVDELFNEEIGFSAIIQKLVDKKLHMTCFDKSMVM